MSLTQTQALKLESTKAVYEHLSRLRDDDASFYSVYLQKIHRLMTVQVLLFASMSFALSQLEWTKGKTVLHVWILSFTAILGGFFLLYGFYYCIKCLGITDVQAVGVTTLNEALKAAGGVREIPPTVIYAELSRNLAGVIVHERQQVAKRRPWGPRVNYATQAAFVFVAIFVTYAIIGKVTTSVFAKSKEPKMPEESVEAPQSSEDAPVQDVQPAASVSDSSERPSLVEPPDVMQHARDPATERRTLVEPADLICGENPRPANARLVSGNKESDS